MKKYFGWLLLITLIAAVMACQSNSSSKSKPVVLCSITPYKSLIEKIGGDSIEVQTIVPDTSDIHTYEPTIRQMQNIQNADIWFYIGEPIEMQLLEVVKEQSPHLQTVDLKENLGLIHHHSCCSSQDLHIWLSPRLLKQQVATIEKALLKAYPENADMLQENSKELQRQLTELEQEISSVLQNSPHKKFAISHPALAYFCQDYHLSQYSIEHQGKSPTPQHIIQLTKDITEHNIRSIFIIPQIDRKKAEILAESLHLDTYEFNPYAPDCLSNLKEFAYHLTDADNE